MPCAQRCDNRPRNDKLSGYVFVEEYSAIACAGARRGSFLKQVSSRSSIHIPLLHMAQCLRYFVAPRKQQLAPNIATKTNNSTGQGGEKRRGLMHKRKANNYYFAQLTRWQKIGVGPKQNPCHQQLNNSSCISVSQGILSRGLVIG
jgi:hypothetical protein